MGVIRENCRVERELKGERMRVGTLNKWVGGV